MKTTSFYVRGELRAKRILFGLSTRETSMLTGVSMAQIRKVETLSDDLISKRGLCGTKKRLETVYTRIYETMSISDKTAFDTAIKILVGNDFRTYMDPLFKIFDDGSSDSDDLDD